MAKESSGKKPGEKRDRTPQTDENTENPALVREAHVLLEQTTEVFQAIHDLPDLLNGLQECLLRMRYIEPMKRSRTEDPNKTVDSDKTSSSSVQRYRK